MSKGGLTTPRAQPSPANRTHLRGAPPPGRAWTARKSRRNQRCDHLRRLIPAWRGRFRPRRLECVFLSSSVDRRCPDPGESRSAGIKGRRGKRAQLEDFRNDPCRGKAGAGTRRHFTPQRAASGGRWRRRRRHRRREGFDAAVPARPRARVEGRHLRGRLHRPGRRAVRRGLPDLAADPEPVQRPAADPAGGQAADAGRGRGPAAAARAWCGPAELAPQRDAPDLAGRHRLPGPDRLQVRPARPYTLLHHVAGAADRLARPADEVVRCDRQHLPGRHRPHPAAVDHLRLQRHVPRPADQRRVRQARDRPVREPPGREPAQPGPAGLRFDPTSRS